MAIRSPDNFENVPKLMAHTQLILRCISSQMLVNSGLIGPTTKDQTKQTSKQQRQQTQGLVPPMPPRCFSPFKTYLQFLSCQAKDARILLQA